MFFVVRAELTVAEAALTSAKDVAVYAYAAERLADGEGVAAEKILSLFDQKLVRDVAMTGLFYARCDTEVLKRAHVGQGLGGMWVDTEEEGENVRAEITYRVKPPNLLTEEKTRYYKLRIVYRNWTGEGKIKAGEEGEGTEQSQGRVVYMTEHGTVYHERKTCSHIKIETMAVTISEVAGLRNDSGAKYYACDFCSPQATGTGTVYITTYGTRYHSVSSCSAIYRNVKEYQLEEVKDRYPACSRCGSKEEKGES